MKLRRGAAAFMTWESETEEIVRRRELALGQGGAEAIAKQHSQN